MPNVTRTPETGLMAPSRAGLGFVSIPSDWKPDWKLLALVAAVAALAYWLLRPNRQEQLARKLSAARSRYAQERAKLRARYGA